MKKVIASFLILLPFLLTSCNSLANTTSDGSEWSSDWVEVGLLLGIEKNAGGFQFTEVNDVLGLNGINNASWVYGETKQYTKPDGEDVTLHEAEAYVLVQEFPKDEQAQQATVDWKAVEETNYTLGDERKITCAGQEFSACTLTPKAESPYSDGIAAFAVHNNFAVSVEMMFQEEFEGDKENTLNEFLDDFHYRAGK